MLTIFTTTKPFVGHTKTIQTNAIRSWKRLGSQVNIILMGNSKGTKEFAKKNNLKYISGVRTNKYKTPLVSSLFTIAKKNSSEPILAYVNADIILFSSFLDAIEKISKDFSKYLIIGQRIDANIENLVDFNDNNQVKNLINQAKRNGKLHAVSGIDYFIYPRNFWEKIPNFGIGRLRWDNWLVYKGKQLGTVIDATKFIKIIHQNHDFFHLPQGLEGERFKAEFKINQRLAESYFALVSDADYLLTKFGLIKNYNFLKNPLVRKLINILL